MKYVLPGLLNQLVSKAQGSTEYSELLQDTFIEISQRLGEEYTARHILHPLILHAQRLIYSPTSGDERGGESMIALRALERLVALPSVSGGRLYRVFLEENPFLFSLLLVPHHCERNVFLQVVEVLAVITHRIGYHLSLRAVRPYLQQFFASYESLAKIQPESVRFVV